MIAKQIIFKKYIKSIAILFGPAMLFSCQPDLERIETITAKDDTPVESLLDVKIIQSSHGKTQVIIEAPRMDRYENAETYMELKEGINVVFYDTLKRPTSKLKSDYAISYDDENIVEAKNDVVVVNEFDEKLNTEHLIWDQNKEIIYSEKFVKITTQTEILYGDGFKSDEKFEKWKILQPRGTFSIEDP